MAEEIGAAHHAEHQFDEVVGPRRPIGTPLEERHIDIDDVRIAYQVGGSGPNLFLIHGLSASCRWWVQNTAAFTPYYRVYAIDLIGFGSSRGRHRFSLNEAADYLARMMEVLELVHASVIGHSMGGFIAAQFAADYPQRVDRLVLVDPAIVPLENRRLNHALEIIRSLGHIQARFLPLVAHDAFRAGARTLRSAANELLTSDLQPKLPTIQSPVLVIWGENDKLLPITNGPLLVNAIPNATFETIPQAGHVPMWDQPQAFNRLVLNFLQSTAPLDADPLSDDSEGSDSEPH